MPSTAIDSQIHGCMFSTDEMRRIWSDQSWAQKWLDTEAALAKAQGELGVIPQEKAELINKYAKAELLDIPSIGESFPTMLGNLFIGVRRVRILSTLAWCFCSVMPIR